MVLQSAVSAVARRTGPKSSAEMADMAALQPPVIHRRMQSDADVVEVLSV